MSAGALALATGSASAASALIPVTASTGLGVYSTTHVRDGKVGVPDLGRGDAIVADCWDRGDNIGNRGNVWYHTRSERYTGSSGQELFVTGWTYGPMWTAMTHSTAGTSRSADGMSPAARSGAAVPGRAAHM
ncbi:hypothetical protein [Streptomyces sp. SP2-10]|uniref:hypothetical protein n=1 Tax=Streptomyces sp. SP2-10 TaxID=2873385 RepID=UPI001CA6D33E|nr:hypothetical protein [Streptomyces sp. SP2-10]MBY8844401.1 hypothetical protein [Streptomyces sp. SP2-10]